MNAAPLKNVLAPLIGLFTEDNISPAPTPRRKKSSQILLHKPKNQLYLFRKHAAGNIRADAQRLMPVCYLR
jgi:hypothetical protein